MLDLSFLAVVDNREKYQVFPKRCDPLFRMRRVKVSLQQFSVLNLYRNYDNLSMYTAVHI